MPTPEIDLHQLKVFHSVARFLSYSRAGEALSLSQPAVSRRVASLEASLGVELFTRRGRQITLTDAGRCLYDYADRIFNLTEQAARTLAQFKNLEQGEVLVGACSTVGRYVLPELLQSFRQQYPGLKISLQLGNSAQIEKLIVNGTIDLGFTGKPVQSPNLHTEPFLADELVLIISPGHSLQEKKEVRIGDLADQTLLWREEGSATRSITETYLRGHNFKTAQGIEIGDTEAIKKMVMAGAGVSFVSRYAVASELNTNLLKTAPGGEMKIARHFYLAFAKDRFL
ncbi:MAG: LysR substrate-binding domain-containing protein, partial [Desulfotomaculales bacterium]